MIFERSGTQDAGQSWRFRKQAGKLVRARILVAACLLASHQAAYAQSATAPSQPQPIPASGMVEAELPANSPAGPHGAVFDCYAVDTPPSSRWTIRANSTAFPAEVWVARGALCNVANPAYRQIADLSGAAELSFNSPGGRYLILVRSAAGGGAYTLDVRGGGAPSIARSSGHTQTASTQDDPRVAIMRRQAAELETRRAAEAEAARVRAEQQRLAEAQAAAERRAAEQRRRQENSAFWGAVLTGTVQAMNEVSAEMAAENARMMEAQRRQLAQQQEQARHRQEQERLAREWDARGSAPNRPSGSTAPTTSQQTRDRAAAEASARRLSQQQTERRRQEQALIRQAEERRIDSEQRLAEARSQAWLRQQGGGSSGFAGAGAGSSGSSSGARAMAAAPSGGSSRTGLQPVPRGTEGPSHRGSLSKQVSAVGQCAASSVRLNYDAHTLFGEPLASANWSFQGEEGCTAPSGSTVWLRIESGPAYGYIRISTTAPTANRGEGTSMGSTGMEWDEAACGFDGASTTGCLSEEDAKSLWVNGRVTGFEIGW